MELGRSRSPAPPFKPSLPYNDKVRRGFVEIDKVYEPYEKEAAGAADFLYSEEKNARQEPVETPPPTRQSPLVHMGSKRDMWAGTPTFKQGSVFWKAPAQETPPSAPPTPVKEIPPIEAPKRSRNSIFDTPQIVLKPASKMTHDELSALKRGETASGPRPPMSPARMQAEEKHFSSSLPPPPAFQLAPPAFPVSPTRTPTDTRFLSTFNSPTRRGWIELDADDPTKSRSVEVDLDGMPSPLSPQSAETPQAERELWVYPATSDNVQLSFLPTRRNFLGEGRYSQVFKGQYIQYDSANPQPQPIDTNINDSSSPSPSPIQSPTSSNPTTPRSGRRSRPPSINFRTCAVKRMHPTQEAQAIGLAEIEVLRSISKLHPNIITFIGVKDEADVDSHSPAAQKANPLSPTSSSDTRSRIPRFLIMLEYCSHGCLWDWALRNRERVGRELWVKWGRQLAGAVEVMHGLGIVHHDIKPHNILLTEQLDLRLADFGNACYVTLDEEDVVMDGSTVGGSSAVGEGSEGSDAPANGNSAAPLVQGTPARPQLLRRITPPSLHALQIPPRSDASPPKSSSTASPTSPRGHLQDAIGRGTPAYTAPELLTPSRPYSYPIDMYSVGVTLYAIMTCTEPFALARSPVMMMVGVGKGFFESGMQLGGIGIVDGDGDGEVRWGGRHTGAVVGEEEMGIIRRLVDKDPDRRLVAAQLREAFERMEVGLGKF